LGSLLDLISLKEKLSSKEEINCFAFSSDSEEAKHRVLLLEIYPKEFTIEMIFNFFSIYGGIAKIMVKES
jgi:hypothetical protein